jgi:carbonic anhydrase
MTKHLLSGHSLFRREYFAGEGEYLRTLARDGQNPSTLYIGCSDSRVVPELLTSSRPGELFVVRNIANVVPPLDHADASVGAAIDYAVAALKVPHIVVCGHDGCGGVKAASDGRDAFKHLPSLHEWLGVVAPGVEENVLASIDNLITYPVVADALKAGSLQLHGWVYDINEGRLRVFDVGSEEFVTADRLSH